MSDQPEAASIALCWAASNDDVCRLPKPCPKHDLPQGEAAFLACCGSTDGSHLLACPTAHATCNHGEGRCVVTKQAEAREVDRG